ncbi:Regulator of chromosome condensation [Macleaya cordata]|uniref:Regulator of chromosome condensation n=1 Tax=Macleaya cordata TaxID=56857 RepID=A0A200QXP5_MACCD|nr:Regulator of chromosome condensation [Macleaya cordata]
MGRYDDGFNFSMQNHDLNGFSNDLLNLYCEQGKWKELTLLYHQIRKQGFQPNSFTISSLLKFSSSFYPLSLHQGQSIHADATKRGCIENDAYVINALLTMYAQCGSLFNALKIFDEIHLPTPHPNEITWSAMISGYTQNGRLKDVLWVFKKMRGKFNELGSCLSPNSHTIASVFTACGQLKDLSFGEQVHGYIVKISSYIKNDVFVGSSLIDLYGKCGQKNLAKLVFNSLVEKCVVAWSVLIAMYVQNECLFHAIEAFRKMVYDGVEPNYVTLSTLITACSDMPNLILGKELHSFIVRRRTMSLDAFVLTSLIDMYFKCNCVLYAQRIFENDKTSSEYIPTPMWNALIAGHVENNSIDDAWQLFRTMNRDGNANPNSVTMAIILPLQFGGSEPASKICVPNHSEHDIRFLYYGRLKLILPPQSQPFNCYRGVEAAQANSAAVLKRFDCTLPLLPLFSYPPIFASPPHPASSHNPQLSDGGRLGFGHENPAFVPTPNPNLDCVRSTALGGIHSAALTTVGDVYTWGYGGFGALGHRVYTRELLPRMVKEAWNGKMC